MGEDVHTTPHPSAKQRAGLGLRWPGCKSAFYPLTSDETLDKRLPSLGSLVLIQTGRRRPRHRDAEDSVSRTRKYQSLCTVITVPVLS